MDQKITPGKLPQDQFLLSRAELEKCIKDEPIIAEDEPFGIFLTVDVGLGEYRDESVAVVSKVTGHTDMGDDARRVEYIELPLCTNSRNEVDFTGDLADVFAKLREWAQPVLFVDSGGIGAAVCRLLEKQGIPVERVNWGKPCFSRAYQDRFFNQRACAQVRFRDAVKQGRVRFRFPMDSRLREKLLDQGARLPYEFVEAGGLRYKMMSKDDMRALGIKSPDLIDAMSFAFLEDAHYIEQRPSQAGITANDQKMTPGELPDGLQLAVNALVGCDGYKVEIDAIRAEHAKRLTLQHNAADQAQRIAELEAERATTAAHIASIARQLGDKPLQVDDIAVRVLAVAVECNELRARLADIDGRDSSPPNEEAVLAQFRAYDGSGWAATATPWQIWRDAVKWALYARPVPAIPADPGMLAVGMAPSSAYAMGWNDCRAKMLPAAPEAAR